MKQKKQTTDAGVESLSPGNVQDGEALYNDAGNLIGRNNPDPALGKFASVIKDGNVLGDDGNVYSDGNTAIANSTGWVFFGPGSFYVQQSLNTTNEFTVMGSGWRNTRLRADNNFTFNIDSTPRFEVMNVEFETGLADAEHAITTETDTDSDQEIIVKNCFASELHNYFCNIDGDTTLIFTNNHVDLLNSNTGNVITTDGDYTNISHNYIVGDGGNGDLIEFSTSCYTASVVSNYLLEGDDGIKSEAVQTLVSGNFVADQTSAPIRMGTGTNASTITSNVVTNGGFGIQIQGDDGTISNNVITDCSTAISVGGASNEILDNVFGYNDSNLFDSGTNTYTEGNNPSI